jgi:PKD repeat protein
MILQLYDKLYGDTNMSKLLRVLTLLVFFGLGISCASAANVFSFNPQTVELLPGTSQDVQIVMDSVPDGLSGFNITFSVIDPEIAEITAISFPSWSGINSTSTIPSSSVWIKTVDLNNTVVSGNTNVLMGNITLIGKKAGTTDLNITEGYFDPDVNITHKIPGVNKGNITILEDNESPVINSVILSNSQPYTGDSITVTVNATDNAIVSGLTANNISLLNQGESIWNGNITTLDGTHSVNVSAEDAVGNIAWNNSTTYTALFHVLPGYINPPTDPNHDGLYEDLNGNGKIDFKDVQAFWHNMYWMENQNGLSAYFDFNHNGKVDYKDFQRLYVMASNS